MSCVNEPFAVAGQGQAVIVSIEYLSFEMLSRQVKLVNGVRHARTV